MYSEPPWVFKGRALYQLQLVKSEEVRHSGDTVVGGSIPWSFVHQVSICCYTGKKTHSRGLQACGSIRVSPTIYKYQADERSTLACSRTSAFPPPLCLLQVHTGGLLPGTVWRQSSGQLWWGWFVVCIPQDSSDNTMMPGCTDLQQCI